MRFRGTSEEAYGNQEKTKKAKTPKNGKKDDAAAKGKGSSAVKKILKRKADAEGEKEKEQVERKRVHSKAYHAALNLAKVLGKSDDVAKESARKAGAEAVAAWSAKKK